MSQMAPKRRTAGVVIAALSIGLCLWPTQSAAQEGVQDAETGSSDRSSLPQRWLARVDPWHAIPSGLALRFGDAAVSVGLTPSEAARLLNDDRFVAAVGAPDQGWGLLESMIAAPATIADARRILSRGGATLTRSGVTSFQSAFFTDHPELRNAYLADVGLLIAVRADGSEVMVDLETGRQFLDEGALGGVITAPGGAPLPSPSMSPEEVAAQMWEEAGINPGDPEPIVAADGEPLALPPGPGLNVQTDEPRELWIPGALLYVGALLLAWIGYAAVAIVRRFGKDQIQPPQD